jgi:hypothetical protein
MRLACDEKPPAFGCIAQNLAIRPKNSLQLATSCKTKLGGHSCDTSAIATRFQVMGYESGVGLRPTLWAGLRRSRASLIYPQLLVMCGLSEPRKMAASESLHNKGAEAMCHGK